MMRHFATSTVSCALMVTGPALADSQSSNCSKDHCTEDEFFITDDGGLSLGYFRLEALHEDRGPWRESQYHDPGEGWERDRWERRYLGDRSGREHDDD